MPVSPASSCRLGGVLLALLLLVGCAVAPPDDAAEADAERDLRVRQAEIALRLGDPFNAAELFERAADLAEGETADRLRLQAALVHLDVGDRERAEALLGMLADVDAPAVAPLATIVRARLALPEDAADWVQRLRPVPADLIPRVEAWWLGALAAAHRAADDPLEAARVLDRQTPLLASERDRRINRERLWSALMALPLPQLRELVPAAPDRFGAWLELAHALRVNRLDAAATEEAVAGWRERYPEHPAAGEFSEARLAEQLQRLRPPERITVMLPFTGRLGSVAEAVQRGMLVALYDMPADERPTLQFQDVGEDGSNVIAAYRRAQEWGADLVVGPLTKSALEQLAIWDNYPVPVLALNRRDEVRGQPGLFQFGLAPEDDAMTAARLAVQLGHRRLTVLVPDSDWGDRVAASFVAGLHAAGGRALEVQSYRPDGEDLSEPLRALFDLDASEARHRRLQGVIGRGLEFEPRRRADMQALFAPAFPDMARLIIPQVRFHRGLGLPVLATSHAYSGTPAPDADADMNGLMFVETPWVLGELQTPELTRTARTLAETWPDTAARYPRLAALGVDALRLSAPVDVLAVEPRLTLEGATGELSVDDQGRVRRELLPARIRSGRIESLVFPSAEVPEWLR
ncbi:penicillin-binding protein activator [Spiribacter halobius]|uniref:penicillin-binding protein activator n=1 Tax=Sediminicurvatus halobius TaxID=2182432 RepID=UPI0013049442|nr:penicillin-binding protein activator [Spiribacter halobius]UEX78863.1 penicillin-binding protein activator [Spiribacter halobius]